MRTMNLKFRRTKMMETMTIGELSDEICTLPDDEIMRIIFEEEDDGGEEI